MTVSTPFSTIPDTIFGRFLDRITNNGDGGGAITTIEPNGDIDEPPTGLFASISILEGRRTQAEFAGSSPRSRTTGVFNVELYDDLNRGTKRLTTLAERVRVAFDRWRSSNGIQFRTCVLAGGSSGQRTGGRWQIVVQCEFYADDI